jgi:DNA-binding response OmpR family regulator
MTMQMTMIAIPQPRLSYPVRLAAAGERPRGAAGARDESHDRAGERLLGKRILVVEDEALVAFELQLSLEDEGAEVIGPAQSLMTAFEAVTHEPNIDLAVLDVDLGGEDVYPVAEVLLRRRVPFVFHTGHGSRSELTALFPGTTTFIKPTLPETLIAHLLKIAR